MIIVAEILINFWNTWCAVPSRAGKRKRVRVCLLAPSFVAKSNCHQHIWGAIAQQHHQICVYQHSLLHQSDTYMHSHAHAQNLYARIQAYREWHTLCHMKQKKKRLTGPKKYAKMFGKMWYDGILSLSVPLLRVARFTLFLPLLLSHFRFGKLNELKSYPIIYLNAIMYVYNMCQQVFFSAANSFVNFATDYVRNIPFLLQHPTLMVVWLCHNQSRDQWYIPEYIRCI